MSAGSPHSGVVFNTAGFVPEAPTFDEDVVRLSMEIMRGRSPGEQHKLVRDIMLSFLPQRVPDLFK